MHDALRHRGPDGEGLLLADASLNPLRVANAEIASEAEVASAQLALTFRRLRIIDLDARADAPLRRGNRWIAVNGEIYNYRELRGRLESLGTTFTTSSDTEVALAAYEQWGTRAFEEMRGMWALLIVDLDRGVLIGSRDRLGIKPLFYGAEDGHVVFASEPKIVAAAMPGGARVQPYRFAEFLRGMPPQSATLSFFDGVHPVPAGTWFEIDLCAPAAPQFEPFWRLESNGDGDPQRLRALLEETVALHLVGDVPVGALLSGGIDSSVLARLMAQLHSGPTPRTFTMTHADPRLDESPFARAVIARGGLDPTFDAFKPESGWESVDRVIAAQGEPLLGFDLIGQHRMFEVAREHGVPVVLDGVGADEIFGGYPFCEAVHIIDRFRRLHLRDAFGDVHAAARRAGRSMPRLIAGYARSVNRNRRMRPYYSWQVPVKEPPHAVVRSGTTLDDLLRTQTLHTNLQSTMLHQDRNSMAHSIESRPAYLDHRIVEFAFSLPDEWKIHRGERKRVLLEVARQLLPPEVTERKEKRAIVSSSSWIDMRKHRVSIEKAIDRGALAACPLVDFEKTRRFALDYFEGSHRDASAVWRLFTATRWLESIT